MTRDQNKLRTVCAGLLTLLASAFLTGCGSNSSSSSGGTGSCPSYVVVPSVVRGNDMADANSVPWTGFSGNVRSHLSGMQQLKSHIPPAVQTSTDLGTLDPDQPIEFSISLQMPNPDEFEQFVKNLSDPNSPDYQKFLTHEELKQRFYLSAEQLQDVINTLAANNIEVLSHSEMLIQARGTVTNIEAFFNTEMSYYLNSRGNVFFAPKYELQIPTALPIATVHGLNNVSVAHKHTIHQETQVRKNTSFPTKSGMTPTDIRKAYGIPTGSGASATGSGQTVALVELDGFNMADIVNYENCFNTKSGGSYTIGGSSPNCGSGGTGGTYSTPSPTITTIPVGGPVTAGENSDEVTLDIEMVIAVAPAATIRVYEAPSLSYSAIIAIYDRIISDNIAKIVSTSWGIPESGSDGLSSSELDQENTLFQTMTAQGITFFAASGDSGAFDDLNNGSCQLLVDDPSVQPQVIGVGGTKLFTNTNGSYASETSWNELAVSHGAGGGGISSHFTIQSWQLGSITSAQSSTTMRNTPDVSLNADPYTAYAVYWTDPGTTPGAWYQIGGTSAAAPLWAGFLALVNAGRVANSKTILTSVAQNLYTIAQSGSYSTNFNDIKDGTTNGHYSAVTGYDNTTGLGSFNGTLLNTLIALP